MMDKLPRHNELVFRNARKTLYLRLTTVIRSLGCKFQNTADQEKVWSYAEKMNVPMDVEQVFIKTNIYGRIFCVCGDIRRTIPLYQIFLAGKSGFAAHTRKLEAGIQRLEFLRDNWDDLEVTGDPKNGYNLAKAD